MVRTSLQHSNGSMSAVMVEEVGDSMLTWSIRREHRTGSAACTRHPASMLRDDTNESDLRIRRVCRREKSEKGIGNVIKSSSGGRDI